MTERDPVQREREVIVTNGGGGSGIGMIVAAVILVLGVILAIWYFNNQGGDISIPDEVNINVDSDDPGTATTANTN